MGKNIKFIKRFNIKFILHVTNASPFGLNYFIVKIVHTIGSGTSSVN